MTIEVRQWKRPDKLDIPADIDKTGYGFKWVTKERLQSRMSEGWEIVPRVASKSAKLNHETGQVDGAIHVRELILCRMPQHMVDQRNQYYTDKNLRRMGAIKRGTKLKQETQQANRDANKTKDTGNKSFVTTTGSIQITQPGNPVALEPMLDEKQVQEDIDSLGK